MSQLACDIVDSINAIRQFVQGFDRETFAVDRRTRSAVEYELLRISEACGKIRDVQAKLEMPAGERIEAHYSHWAPICAIGNILRHEYGRVNHDIIWDTVGEGSDLHDLQAAIQAYFDL